MRYTILAILVLLFSCKTKKSAVSNAVVQEYITKPGIIIYKTKADYFNNVPVNLSEDKSTLVSYPAPSDLKLNDSLLRYPIKLKENYLLDNKGIWVNVAFLSTTYKDFSALQKSPAVDEIMEMVIDKDPIIEFYFNEDKSLDSLKNEQLINYLNKLIDKKQIETELKRLK